jgi:hypothetical protein
MVLPESSGVFLLVPMLFGRSGRAYSHGLGESVDMASNLSSAHNDSAAAAGGLFSFQ